MQVEEGDLLIRESTGERFIVKDVERHKASRLMQADMNHCSLTLMYEKTALKRREEATTNRITQHIGSAHMVAGRDITGGVVSNISVVYMFAALEDAIIEDESIPSEQKKSILDQIKSLATNPFVLGVAPPLLVEAFKKQFGL